MNAESLQRAIIHCFILNILKVPSPPSTKIPKINYSIKIKAYMWYMKTKMLASGNLIAYTQQKVKQQMSWSTISPGSKNNKPLRHELSSHNKPTNAKNSRQTAEQMLEKFAALIQITLSVTRGISIITLTVNSRFIFQNKFHSTACIQK